MTPCGKSGVRPRSILLFALALPGSAHGRLDRVGHSVGPVQVNHVAAVGNRDQLARGRERRQFDLLGVPRRIGLPAALQRHEGQVAQGMSVAPTLRRSAVNS